MKRRLTIAVLALVDSGRLSPISSFLTVGDDGRSVTRGFGSRQRALMDV
jgi:hypothetical protein